MNKIFKNLIIAAIFALTLSATAKAETFYAYLSSAQEVPTNASTGTGYARIVLNESAGTIAYTVVFNNLTSAQVASHIHTPAAIGANGPVVINFGAVGGTSGTITGTAAITAAQVAQIRAHQGYVNVHSMNFTGGEIRGQLGSRRPVDFDGDGRTDFSVLRFPSVTPPGVAQITYYNLNSTGGFQSAQFGNANTDFPTPGDYDGDGLDDIAVYRNGSTAGAQSYFYSLRSSNNTFQVTAFGTAGDQAVARDYDGDSKTDFAVFRRGTTAGSPALWYICPSATVAPSSCGVNFRAIHWGTTGDGTTTGDTPVAADYDGDGKVDLAVYRYGGLNPNNTFIILRSSDGGTVNQQWGNFQSDYIAPGDYDGDGKADFCAVRTGASASTPIVWYILQSSNGQSRAVTFGITSDLLAQGDYDGDARTDIAVYRSGATAGAANNFYILNSLSNALQTTQWGIRGDFSPNTVDAR